MSNIDYGATLYIVTNLSQKSVSKLKNKNEDWENIILVIENHKKNKLIFYIYFKNTNFDL